MVAAQYHRPHGIFYGGGAHNNNRWKIPPPFCRMLLMSLPALVGVMSNRIEHADGYIHRLGKHGDYGALVKNVGEHPLTLMMYIALLCQQC